MEMPELMLLAASAGKKKRANRPEQCLYHPVVSGIKHWDDRRRPLTRPPPAQGGEFARLSSRLDLIRDGTSAQIRAKQHGCGIAGGPTRAPSSTQVAIDTRHSNLPALRPYVPTAARGIKPISALPGSCVPECVRSETCGGGMAARIGHNQAK